MNKVIIMGRITADPELRRTPSDIPVTSFTVAVNRPKQKDGTQQTDWVDCQAWRGTSEMICKWWNKGKLILIEGTLQTRSYEDKQGNKRKVVEVVVDRAHFCGDGKNAISENPNSSTGTSSEIPADDDFAEITGDDDLPF